MTSGLLLLAACFAIKDPAPSMTRTKAASARLDCALLTPETASRAFPGEVAPPAPRGDYVERTVLACEERLMRPGLRSASDEAILSSLEETASGLAAAAASLGPEPTSRTWLVEAYVPDPQVAAKVSFATKAALMRHGLMVSDRTPVLGATDVEILGRMAPNEAYPAACARYAATGGIGAGDALLAVVLPDARATVLHAGLCADGRWAWIR